MSHLRKTDSVTYLRTLALARIVLDNVPNLQSSWVTMGHKVGQIALRFGANDYGSLMMEENVVSAAGTTYRTTLDQIERLIRDAGFEPGGGGRTTPHHSRTGARCVMAGSGQTRRLAACSLRHGASPIRPPARPPARQPMIRVGIGYDSHPFTEGRPLILGGQHITHHKGLAGYSDADAVAHALTDAILGAVGRETSGPSFRR